MRNRGLHDQGKDPGGHQEDLQRKFSLPPHTPPHFFSLTPSPPPPDSKIPSTPKFPQLHQFPPTPPIQITNDFTPEEEAQVREENKWCEEA